MLAILLARDTGRGSEAKARKLICVEGGHCIACPHWKRIAGSFGGSQEKDIALQTIRLSNRHSRCLCLLWQHRSKPVNKGQLTSHVWIGGCVGPSSLAVLIHELRILVSKCDLEIIAVRGTGYLIYYE